MQHLLQHPPAHLPAVPTLTHLYALQIMAINNRIQPVIDLCPRIRGRPLHKTVVLITAVAALAAAAAAATRVVARVAGPLIRLPIAHVSVIVLKPLVIVTAHGRRHGGTGLHRLARRAAGAAVAGGKAGQAEGR